MHKSLAGFFFATLLAIVGSNGSALAQEPIKVKISRLSFPSLSTMMIDIVKARGIDKKHGIDLEGPGDAPGKAGTLRLAR